MISLHILCYNYTNLETFYTAFLSNMNIKKNQKISYREKSIIATLILILCMAVLSGIYVSVIYRTTEEQSYEELARTTREAVDEFESNYRSDRSMLRMLSKAISSEENIHGMKVINYLDFYNVNNLISNIGILQADNKVIQATSSNVDATGVLDFKAESTLGEHITGPVPSLENPEKDVIRSFVPIRKNGKTIAMLYGAAQVNNVARTWTPNIYDGLAMIAIIDRDTGKTILTTLESESEQLLNVLREENGAFEGDSFADILAGKSGYIVFQPEDADEFFFLCHMPMSIANWEMTVIVRENTIFASVHDIRNSLILFIIGLAFLLLIYFIYILTITKTSIQATERRANVDALTGLQNRNRYEYFCNGLEQGTDGLICIYIDVNGLHDLNNSKGHLAGDTMLKFVASTLMNEFGPENTYRIGGDEFVAFRYDKIEDQARSDMAMIAGKIEEAGYHIAYGLCLATPDKKLSVVIKQAETEMYDNKKAYYDKLGKTMRT